MNLATTSLLTISIFTAGSWAIKVTPPKVFPSILSSNQCLITLLVVTASASAGIATSEPYNCVPQTEDTITLLVDWESSTNPKYRGTAVYTASWTAPMNAGIHSGQHWHYMGSKGDIHIDQAHRGYEVVIDGEGKT
jgi:predicted dehydrogenase